MSEDHYKALSEAQAKTIEGLEKELEAQKEQWIIGHCLNCDKLQATIDQLERMLDYNKQKLDGNITDILVQTLYRFVFSEKFKEMTAAEILGLKRKAIDYYNGTTDNLKCTLPMQQVEFHHVVNLQLGLIMRTIEEALAAQPKKGKTDE